MVKKRLFSLILVWVFLLAWAAPSISALDGAKPVSIAGKWYNPQLTSIEKQEKAFILKTTANGQALDLRLAFPKEGGIRLYAGEGGVFRPSSLNTIQYSNESDGRILMKATDGTTVRYYPGVDKWRLDVFNASGAMVYRFSKNQLYYGFNNKKLTKVKLTAAVSNGEVITGTGERYNDVNQMGYRVELWNADTGYHGSGGVHEDLTWSYKNVPIFHSTRGYTLFFNSTYHGIADIAKTDKNLYSLEFGGPILDVYVWTGEPLKNLDGYTQLTGRTVLPPKWAFQYWTGQQAGYWTAGGGMINNLENVMKGYDKLGTPNIAALYGEGSPSADIRAYSLLKRSQTRMMMWYTPRQLRSTVMGWLPGVLAQDMPFPRSLRNPSVMVTADLVSLDFSNPNGKVSLQNYFRKYWDWGLRGAMVDFGEYVEAEHLYNNGMSGYEMHNYYPNVYGKAMYDAWSEELGDDFVLFARAASAGSQRWTANFGGDQASTYPGLKQQLYGGLSLSSSGFSIWGGDIGGHVGTLTPDLYMRWLQFGTFSPLMRAHGISERNPWQFGVTASNCFTMHYWLRENLLDFIYSKAIQSQKTGTPVMQPMALAFPNQKALAGIGDQYLFCDELLIAPILEANAYYRSVTMPSGTWYNLWSGSKQKGGSTIKADAPIDRLPVYVRDGAVIPVALSETLTLTDSMLDEDGVAALVVTPAVNNRTSSYTFDGGTTATYSNAKVSDGTLRITKPASDVRDAVILMGAAASKVVVDGVELDRLDHLPYAYEEVGYYVDGLNRTVLSLADNSWQTIDIVPESGAVNVAATAKVTDSKGGNKASAVIDGNPESYWEASNQAGDWIEVDLGQARNINSIVLKWTDRYASSYGIQVSEDGEYWVDVASDETSTGGVITQNIEPIKARYVSVLVNENAQKAPAALYGFEVYSKLNESLIEDEYEEDEDQEPIESDPDGETDVTDGEDGGNVDNTTTKTTRKNKPVDGDDSGMPLGTIIGLIVAGVVLAAGVTLLCVITARRKKSADTKTEES